MLQTLVKKWFAQIGVEDLSDEDCLNVIRKYSLDKLPPHYLLMMKVVSPMIFMTLAKLNDETIDWGNLDDVPGFEEISKENIYPN